MTTAKEIIADVQRKIAIPRESNDCCSECGGNNISNVTTDDGRDDLEPEDVICDDCGNVMYVI